MFIFIMFIFRYNVITSHDQVYGYYNMGQSHVHDGLQK